MVELEEELKTYLANKERLLKEGLDGQFILIHKSEILGIYPDADKAYQMGLEKLGNVPMFIQKIQKEDPPATAPAYMFGLLHARL